MLDMASSTVKYTLFVMLLVAVMGGELIINSDSSATGMSINEMHMNDGAMTGNFIKETGAGSEPYLLTLIAIMAVLGLIILLKKEWFRWVYSKGLNFESLLLLRVVLGLVLIKTGLDLEPTLAGYASGIVGILLGVLVVLGLFTRLAGYLSFFYCTGMIFYGTPFWQALPLMAIAISLFFQGGLGLSLDNARKKS